MWDQSTFSQLTTLLLATPSEAGHIKRASKTDPKRPSPISSVARRHVGRDGLSHPSDDRAQVKRPETSLERARRKVLAADVEATLESGSPAGFAHHAVSHGRSRRLAQVAGIEDEATPARRVGTRQRARRGIRATTILFALVAGVFSLSLWAMTHVVWSEYRLYQGEVERREATLRDLQEQLETGRKRLAVLQSPKGREQLLIEHGYIRPGDRILLFPSIPEERRAAAISKNDLSPHPATHSDGGARSSAWRRAGDTLSSWWQGFNAPVSKPSPPPVSSPSNSKPE